MLDIKLIRENPEKINELLKRRNPALSIDEVIKIDEERRKIQTAADELRAKRKRDSQMIGELKKKLEEHYPIIYEKTTQVPNADEVRKILSQGKSLEQALNETRVVYKKLYKIIRVHDLYNELDMFSFNDRCVYKFKCKIPLVALIEEIRRLGKNFDAMNNLNFLYKLNVIEK